MESDKNPQSYLQKALGILVRPNTTLATIELKQGESIVTVTILYVTVLLKGILQLNYLGEKSHIGWLVIGAAFGLVAAWFGLAFLYHFLARIFGGSGKLVVSLLSVVGQHNGC